MPLSPLVPRGEREKISGGCFKMRQLPSGRPSNFRSDAAEWLSRSRLSKNTNRHADDSGEPDRQEAGRLPQRPPAMLFGAQNPPEMVAFRESRNMASVHPCSRQPLFSL